MLVDKHQSLEVVSYSHASGFAILASQVSFHLLKGVARHHNFDDAVENHRHHDPSQVVWIVELFCHDSNVSRICWVGVGRSGSREPVYGSELIAGRCYQ